MSHPTGVTLDTGALLALERGDQRIRALLRKTVEASSPVSVPAGVVAQAWRGGPRQARLARLLADPLVEVPVLDDMTARAVGLVCGRTGTADVVDVQVALSARERSHAVVTSDRHDIFRIDPALTIIEI